VKAEVKEHWLQLCERAAVEQDHGRLLQLIAEITRLLEEKERRLKDEKRAQAQGPGSRSL
jgi:hypothetical protein